MDRRDRFPCASPTIERSPCWTLMNSTLYLYIRRLEVESILHFHWPRDYLKKNTGELPIGLALAHILPHVSHWLIETLDVRSPYPSSPCTKTIVIRPHSMEVSLLIAIYRQVLHLAALQAERVLLPNDHCLNTV